MVSSTWYILTVTDVLFFFFNNGLRWHLFGFLQLPRGVIFLFIHYGSEEPSFSSFWFYGPSFFIYEHVVDEQLPPAQHSTSQSALLKAAKQVRDDQSVTTQAKQTELARDSMPPSIHTARCVVKTNEEIEAARPTKDTSTHTAAQRV